MKLLFDTHTFIWWFNERKNLSQRIMDLCANRKNTLILSVVSIWEMQIKLQIGKYSLAKPLQAIIDDEQKTNQVEMLPIRLDHVLALDKLPLHHKDPFDRLLVAQAIVEDAVLVSRDPEISKYEEEVIW